MIRKNKTIYLVDGSSYIHRAYHAIRHLANSKGLPTNAVLGFTKMILKLYEDRELANAEGFAGGTRRPVFLWLTSSGIPPVRVATIGS